jgi:tRNA U34 2-thiouridine synthase MnmA/TrmU
MTKAIGLLSGGLDSTLAIKIMTDQGIDVIALNFTSPFCTCTKKGCRHEASRVAEELDVKIKVVPVTDEYLKMVRSPKFGYGRNINPCIDCRILMLKKAKVYMEEIGAEFLFTGEVLGQRPMSQRKHQMELIEKEAGLNGLILRPLSAKSMKTTIPEKTGIVDRDKLLNISGRNRKPQIQMAEDFGFKDFNCPAGGCLLTQKQFANKLRDLFNHKKHVTMNDISLLKLGRHFRYSKNKIIVGRNEEENDSLLKRKQTTDYVFEVPDYGSPITILQGAKTHDAILVASRLTARYSDCDGGMVKVKYGKDKPTRTINVNPFTQEEIDKMNLAVTK